MFQDTKQPIWNFCKDFLLQYWAIFPQIQVKDGVRKSSGLLF